MIRWEKRQLILALGPGSALSLSIKSNSLFRLWANSLGICLFFFFQRRHIWNLWPGDVTLTSLLCHWMLLIVLYLDISYDVCGCNCLRNMTICTFLWPLIFIYDLQRFCHGHFHSITCVLCCCMLVLIMKLVASIDFEIWSIVWRKPIWRLHSFDFLEIQCESTKGISKQHTEFHFDRT